MWMKHDKSCLSLTLHNCATSGWRCRYDTYLFLDKCSYHSEPSPQLTPLVHRGGFSHGGVHGGDRLSISSLKRLSIRRAPLVHGGGSSYGGANGGGSIIVTSASGGLPFAGWFDNPIPDTNLGDRYDARVDDRLTTDVVLSFILVAAYGVTGWGILRRGSILIRSTASEALLDSVPLFTIEDPLTVVFVDGAYSTHLSSLSWVPQVSRSLGPSSLCQGWFFILILARRLVQHDYFSLLIMYSVPCVQYMWVRQYSTYSSYEQKVRTLMSQRYNYVPYQYTEYMYVLLHDNTPPIRRKFHHKKIQWDVGCAWNVDCVKICEVHPPETIGKKTVDVATRWVKKSEEIFSCVLLIVLLSPSVWGSNAPVRWTSLPDHTSVWISPEF